MFKELKIKIDDTLILWCDNFRVGFLTSNLVFHVRNEHIEIDVHSIQEKVMPKELNMQYILIEEQIVDYLIKSLLDACFKIFKDKLIVVQSIRKSSK